MKVELYTDPELASFLSSGEADRSTPDAQCSGKGETVPVRWQLSIFPEMPRFIVATESYSRFSVLLSRPEQADCASLWQSLQQGWGRAVLSAFQQTGYTDRRLALSVHQSFFSHAASAAVRVYPGQYEDISCQLADLRRWFGIHAPYGDLSLLDTEAASEAVMELNSIGRNTGAGERVCPHSRFVYQSLSLYGRRYLAEALKDCSLVSGRENYFLGLVSNGRK